MRIRVAERRSEQHLVTMSPDGQENWWQLVHSVSAVDAVPDDDRPDNADDVEWTSCEWVIRSGWHKGECKRGAAKNRFGLSLCWQHEDSAFDHVKSQLIEGRYSPTQVSHIADVLIRSEARRDADRLPGALSRLIDERLADRLEAIADGRYRDPQLEELLDGLIEKRLQQNWGAST